MCSLPGEGSAYRLTQGVVGRIHFLVTVGLKSSGSCRLFVGSHFQLLKAIHRSLPHGSPYVAACFSRSGMAMRKIPARQVLQSGS